MVFLAQHCPAQQIGQQAAAQLQWFHIVTLLTKLEITQEREWYATQAVRYRLHFLFESDFFNKSPISNQALFLTASPNNKSDNKIIIFFLVISSIAKFIPSTGSIK